MERTVLLLPQKIETIVRLFLSSETVVSVGFITTFTAFVESFNKRFNKLFFFSKLVYDIMRSLLFILDLFMMGYYM